MTHSKADRTLGWPRVHKHRHTTLAWI